MISMRGLPIFSILSCILAASSLASSAIAKLDSLSVMPTFQTKSTDNLTDHTAALGRTGQMFSNVAAGTPSGSLASTTETSDSAPLYSRIFLVQRGHILTPRLVAQAVLAKTQILAADGAYHFMLKSAHQRDPLQPSTTTSISLALLQDALGSDHVSHVIAKDILTQFPGLVEWSSDYGMGGYESTNSDVFDYALYSRFKSGGMIPSWATKIWLMEWDVAWTGNLPDILTQLFDPDSNFVGYDTVNASVLLRGNTCVQTDCKLWQHVKKRTWPLKDTDVFHSTAMMLRLDVRLLDSLVRHYANKEWLFNEAAGPTVCIIGESSWCKVDWTFMPGHPALGQHPGSNVSMFYWNYHMNESQWVRTLQEFQDRRVKDLNALGHLYHALKW